MGFLLFSVIFPRGEPDSPQTPFASLLDPCLPFQSAMRALADYAVADQDTETYQLTDFF